MELAKDIFIIRLQGDNNIIYSPLRSAAFFANRNAAEVVQKYIEKRRCR
jgi:hypothetical protein